MQLVATAKAMALSSRLDEDLAVIQLLLTLHDSVQTAKVVQLSQSAVSRRYRNCEEILGLRIRRTNGCYQLADCEQPFAQLITTAAELRLQSGCLRWSCDPVLDHLFNGVRGPGWWLELSALTQTTSDLTVVTRLLRERIMDLYLCDQTTLQSLIDTPPLDGRDHQTLSLGIWKHQTSTMPLHLLIGIPDAHNSVRQALLMSFVNRLMGELQANGAKAIVTSSA